jgi:hypothetical protein
MNKHLEWIEKKTQELKNVDDPIPILLEVTSMIGSLPLDQVKDVVMYILGRLHDAEQRSDR